jgi:hypothetical protein
MFAGFFASVEVNEFNTTQTPSNSDITNVKYSIWRLTGGKCKPYAWG